MKKIRPAIVEIYQKLKKPDLETLSGWKADLDLFP